VPYLAVCPDALMGFDSADEGANEAAILLVWTHTQCTTPCGVPRLSGVLGPH